MPDAIRLSPAWDEPGLGFDGSLTQGEDMGQNDGINKGAEKTPWDILASHAVGKFGAAIRARSGVAMKAEQEEALQVRMAKAISLIHRGIASELMVEIWEYRVSMLAKADKEGAASLKAIHDNVVALGRLLKDFRVQTYMVLAPDLEDEDRLELESPCQAAFRLAEEVFRQGRKNQPLADAGMILVGRLINAGVLDVKQALLFMEEYLPKKFEETFEKKARRLRGGVEIMVALPEGRRVLDQADLEAMRKTELQALCRERHIHFINSDSKVRLIERLLETADQEGEPPADEPATANG